MEQLHSLPNKCKVDNTVNRGSYWRKLLNLRSCSKRVIRDANPVCSELYGEQCSRINQTPQRFVFTHVLQLLFSKKSKFYEKQSWILIRLNLDNCLSKFWNEIKNLMSKFFQFKCNSESIQKFQIYRDMGTGRESRGTGWDQNFHLFSFKNWSNSALYDFNR